MDFFAISTAAARRQYRKSYANMNQLQSKYVHLKIVSNCKFCGAKRFEYEPPGFCCNNGSIKLVSNQYQEGYSPESSMKIGGNSLTTSTWCQLIQLNFLKHFLGGDFVKHMQKNVFLHDVFGFTSKKKLLSGIEHRISGTEKVPSVLLALYFMTITFLFVYIIIS